MVSGMVYIEMLWGSDICTWDGIVKKSYELRHHSAIIIPNRSAITTT
jgi:hypothetical protein